MAQTVVVFSHGKDSGPWGHKIKALAATVTELGYGAESVDYQGSGSVEQRVAKLVSFCAGLAAPPLLVGSSLGGLVAVGAADAVQARGLLLMAPAFYLPVLPDLPHTLPACPTVIVHGWRDEIVPYDNSIRYARAQQSALHLVDDDHRLYASLPLIDSLLRQLLRSLNSAAAPERAHAQS
jgi:predicted alpha/beta-hydrolase family hydrolase